MKNSHQNHIPQTTGWSDQVRDFGKFWEVLGRGSGETLQTTHGYRCRGGTPNKTLKSSQYLSKTPTCAANSTPASHCGYQIPQTTGWSDQMRDFGKFWEVLGRGSGETLQTNHGIDPEAAHQIKLSNPLNTSQKFPPVPHPIDCTPQGVSNTADHP